MSVKLPYDFIRKLRRNDNYIASFSIDLGDLNRADVRYSYYEDRRYWELIPYIVQWGGTRDSFLYIIIPKRWEAYEEGKRAKTLAKENFPNFKGFDETTGYQYFARSKKWLPSLATIKKDFRSINSYGCAMELMFYPDNLEFEVRNKRTRDELFFSIPPGTEAYNNYFWR